ncbi:hypothetical protein ACQZ6F_19015 [Rhizobium sp. A22-96]
MKRVALVAAALAAFTAGPAIAAPVDHRVNVTADPAAMCGPNSFCSGRTSLIFQYDDRAIQGDVVVWGCHGCRGEVIEGMPPWMRKVTTSTGYDLVGRPQPGAYAVKSYYDGVYKPSLDEKWTFIPR